MRKTTAVLALITGLSSLPALSFAADSVTVPAGTTSAITEFSNVSEACQSIGKPKPSVMKEPKHGKVTFKWVSSTMDEGSCKGKPVKAMRVFYTPDSDFSGEDYFKFGMTYAQYEDGAGNTFASYGFDVTVE